MPIDSKFTKEELRCLAKDIAPHLADEIAPLVRDQLRKQFHENLGKTVMSKFFIGLGLVTLAVMTFFNGGGWK